MTMKRRCNGHQYDLDGCAKSIYDFPDVGKTREIDGKRYCAVNGYENDVGGGPCATYIIREIPDYIIENQIGEGSHGTVWLGREKENNQIVCIKIAKPGFESALRHEFQILRSIKHQNIICPEVIFDENEKVCMVMPYYPGTAFAIKGKCDSLQVWRFCESMRSALSILHHHFRYLHNDISLSNILVSQDGDFILSDLSNVTKGSSYDIDYWKLGCAAMELITGKQFIVYKYHSDTFIEDSINDTGITDDKLRQFLMYCFSFSPDMPGRLDWINNSQGELSKDIIVWTMVNDFSVIERDGKYGLMNKYGTIVVPIENDSLSQVDFHQVPGHGPYRPPEMRCLFKRDNLCGSYLIDRDYARLELEITLEEWEERKRWT